jgi:hypothetical protein
MLPGQGSQRPTLHSDALVHSGDIQLDLGNRPSQPGHLLPERLTLRLRLLDTQEQVMSARVSIGHHRNRSTRHRATGHPQPADPAMATPPKAISLAVPGRSDPWPRRTGTLSLLTVGSRDCPTPAETAQDNYPLREGPKVQVERPVRSQMNISERGSIDS